MHSLCRLAKHANDKFGVGFIFLLNLHFISSDFKPSAKTLQDSISFVRMFSSGNRLIRFSIWAVEDNKDRTFFSPS
jgi:hypothetical protein